jgi:hypothetical protein
MGTAVAEALREVGLSLSPDDLDQRVATAIRQLAGARPTGEPRAEFSLDEQAALRAGGFDLGPRRSDEEDVGLRAAERYAAILATALTVPQAARRLGVDGSRIRQQLLARQLYGIRQARGWLLPLFQFGEHGLVPGINRVLPRLDPHLHPLSVVGWFTTPKPDLFRPGDPDEIPISPRDWLLSGGDPTIAAELADDAVGYA